MRGVPGGAAAAARDADNQSGRPMTPADNRRYAVDLMNRAGLAFDTQDIGVVSRVIALLEGDVAEWLAGQLRGTVSRERIVAAVREGAHRPGLTFVNPAAAPLEGKLK